MISQTYWVILLEKLYITKTYMQKQQMRLRKINAPIWRYKFCVKQMNTKTNNRTFSSSKNTYEIMFTKKQIRNLMNIVWATYHQKIQKFNKNVQKIIFKKLFLKNIQKKMIKKKLKTHTHNEIVSHSKLQFENSQRPIYKNSNI